MSKKINHWCIICGKGYHACDSCDEIQSFTPWRKLACSPEHYKLYILLKQYNSNVITKEEAKSMLANIDLTGMKDFKESAKKVLDEILKEDIPVRKSSKKKTVETVVEESTTESDAEE